MTPGISISRFAAELGCSATTLKRHIHAGNLRAIDVGTATQSRWVVSAEEAERVRREGLRPRAVIPQAVQRGPTMAEALALLT